MKLIKTLLTPLALALLFGIHTAYAQCPTPGTTVNGTKQISANVLGSPLVISTSNAYAGAITSMTWRGKQFVDSADFGRFFQTAVFPQPQAEAHIPDWVECYNPTEGVPASRLRWISAVGNVLRSRTQLAYYLAPGETGVCGQHGDNAPAHNQCVLSNYILEKTVTIGFAGIPNVIEYEAKVTIPEDIARGEIVIAAYGPANLTWVRKYEFRNKRFSDVIYAKDPNSTGVISDSTNHPTSLLDPSTSLGVTMYSPELMQPNSYPVPNPYLQWVMYPAPNPTHVFWGRFVERMYYPANSVLTRRAYLVVGNYDEMQNALNQLHSYYAKLDPDVFDWQQYLAWYGDVAAAMPGQYNSRNHWDWWGAAEGRRGAMPFWAPAYLQRYPDISNYCGPTNYPCAIDHYINYGRTEGRIGN